MKQYCPKCGPGEFKCITSDEHRQRSGQAITYTCLNCLARWESSGRIVSGVDTRASLGTPCETARSADETFAPYFGDDDLAAILKRYWYDSIPDELPIRG